jgi:hypothetical protein
MNKLIIRKKEWAAILKNCCQDKDNSNSIQVPRIITGSIFAKEINNYYFVYHAYCSICGTKYIFLLIG